MPRIWANAEKDWKKVKPVLMTKTGISEILAKLAVQFKEYTSREAFIDKVASPGSELSDEKRYHDGFHGYVVSLKKQMSSKPETTKNAKTKAFLETMIKDLEEEVKFWAGGPIQKKFKGVHDTTSDLLPKTKVLLAQTEQSAKTLQFDIDKVESLPPENVKKTAVAALVKKHAAQKKDAMDAKHNLNRICKVCELSGVEKHQYKRVDKDLEPSIALADSLIKRYGYMEVTLTRLAKIAN